MQFLGLGQIGKLAGVETVGVDDRLDQAGVGFRGWRERIGVVDHHSDFLASAPQLHRVRERQSWLRRGDRRAMRRAGVDAVG